ncbi:PREDICTED: uncharacterized protein K02A2.6-like [Priapulus caudatus]|uniref:Uncharacterized protein K02A2.6-like n=1 Tax=Priapulus caudatus TaxID=37621 RepID=A0ABM1DRZ0_PRICU|nr:PREDICTED: uncharacterized protein K02A2.6-like [Priapulus caudatus]
MNHFAAVCKGQVPRVKQSWQKPKSLHHVNEQSDNSDESVYSLRHINSTGGIFMVPVKYHAAERTVVMNSQLDTGATCSAMSYRDLTRILGNNKPILLPSTGDIKLYDGTVVVPRGRYTLPVSRERGAEHKVTFDILEKAPWPIFDGATCVKYKWVSLKRVNMTNSEILTREGIEREYSDVFKGLGCLQGEYHIEIDPEIRPVQHAPRRVPVPLKDRLKDKIDHMEKQGIIAKVTKPTEWISSLVAVQSQNKLRVCIDPRDLNKAKTSKIPMPTVEEILPKLAKAKVFTVLDAKDGFFQVKLDEPSSYLTTFWTPFGRYRYLRMPQGISSAPEEYQRRQVEVLDGLLGVEVIADDILCYGSGDTMAEAVQTNDRNLLNLLQRAREANFKV